MLDTNVVISALLFPSKRMNDLIESVAVKNTMVLSSYVIDELKNVIKRKFPTKVEVIDDLLYRMSYELVYTPNHFITDIKIRDEKDLPVIYMAVIEEVDILITGDRDFVDLENLNIEILTPSGYLDKYVY